MPSAIALKCTELLGSTIDALCEGITLQVIGVATDNSVGNANNDLRFDKRETASITGVAGGSSPTANCFELFRIKVLKTISE